LKYKSEKNTDSKFLQTLNVVDLACTALEQSAFHLIGNDENLEWTTLSTKSTKLVKTLRGLADKWKGKDEYTWEENKTQSAIFKFSLCLVVK